MKINKFVIISTLLLSVTAFAQVKFPVKNAIVKKGIDPTKTKKNTSMNAIKKKYKQASINDPFVIPNAVGCPPFAEWNYLEWSAAEQDVVGSFNASVGTLGYLGKATVTFYVSANIVQEVVGGSGQKTVLTISLEPYSVQCGTAITNVEMELLLYGLLSNGHYAAFAYICLGNYQQDDGEIIDTDQVSFTIANGVPTIIK